MNLFGNESEDKEPNGNPTYARAKELFISVDETGESIYTLEEIVEKLNVEGYEKISKSKLSRWSNSFDWKEKRETLKRNAITNAELSKGKNLDSTVGLGSIINLADYIKKTAKINQDGLEVLGNWINALKDRPSISEKEAAVATKVVEATGKLYEEVLKKMGEKDNAKATASEVVTLLKKERGIVDVEVLD